MAHAIQQIGERWLRNGKTDAQAGKASIQRLADRVSAVFVPVVLVIAAATLAGWLLMALFLVTMSKVMLR